MSLFWKSFWFWGVVVAAVGVAAFPLFLPAEPPPWREGSLPLACEWTDAAGAPRTCVFTHGPFVWMAQPGSRWRLAAPGLDPGTVSIRFEAAAEGQPVLQRDETGAWTGTVPAAPGAFRLEISCDAGPQRIRQRGLILVPKPVDDPASLGKMFVYPNARKAKDAKVRAAAERYRAPRQFFWVEPWMGEYFLSPGLRLRDFAAGAQEGPFVPQWLWLEYGLLDKLEAIARLLPEFGKRADDLVVLSGFRPPKYNRDAEGSAFSRHMYGDAADFIVDRDRDGKMDDLDGNGKVNAKDLELLGERIGRLERSNPAWVGGCGLYISTTTLGSVHIDNRGHRARWGTPKAIDAWWDRTKY